MSIDPTATIQEESINLVAEIELQERVFYIKATTQVFTALEGGYLDFGGGMGLNTTLAVFEPEIKDIHWNDAVNGNFKKKNKKVIKKENCIYISSLNKENCIKILKRDFGITCI